MLNRAWHLAFRALLRYRQGGLLADAALEQTLQGIEGPTRQRVYALYMDAMRHTLRLEAILHSLAPRPPRDTAQAIFILAGAECLASEMAKWPAIIDFAVEQAKPQLSTAEVRFLNAVLRKMSAALEAPPDFETVDGLATHYSHPLWLVRRWVDTFGLTDTRLLLQWNQNASRQYLRLETAQTPPQSLTPTRWKHYYTVENAPWSEIAQLLQTGDAYSQDPSTRLAVEALNAQPGETVLDLCAAPGGKARQLAARLDSVSHLVMVDLPGKRIRRLQENLQTVGHVPWAIVQKDVRKLQGEDFTAAQAPHTYHAVLLDAPCSNTGVIQRRPDVKLRLRTESIAEMAAIQQELLQSAARRVKPGGRLVYSTCSIEPEENEAIVQAFLSSHEEFKLTKGQRHLPWQCGHDGAGVFLLRRVAP